MHLTLAIILYSEATEVRQCKCLLYSAGIGSWYLRRTLAEGRACRCRWAGANYSALLFVVVQSRKTTQLAASFSATALSRASTTASPSAATSLACASARRILASRCWALTNRSSSRAAAALHGVVRTVTVPYSSADMLGNNYSGLLFSPKLTRTHATVSQASE